MLSLAYRPLTTRSARVCKAAFMTCGVVTGRWATLSPAEVHVTALMRVQTAVHGRPVPPAGDEEACYRLRSKKNHACTKNQQVAEESAMQTFDDFAG